MTNKHVRRTLTGVLGTCCLAAMVQMAASPAGAETGRATAQGRDVPASTAGMAPPTQCAVGYFWTGFECASRVVPPPTQIPPLEKGRAEKRRVERGRTEKGRVEKIRVVPPGIPHVPTCALGYYWTGYTCASREIAPREKAVPKVGRGETRYEGRDRDRYERERAYESSRYRYERERPYESGRGRYERERPYESGRGRYESERTYESAMSRYESERYYGSSQNRYEEVGYEGRAERGRGGERD
ncbi:hypothetical protein [Sphaerisporangium sp. NPDC051011]|uniref:hypothetical protein n=1 Tax=Sphaerisporangium sp. NPDC051011 TaxID=3155792 RepID=UPI0034107440